MFSEANTRSCKGFSGTKMEGILLEIFVFFLISVCIFKYISLQMDSFMQTKNYSENKYPNRSCVYLEDKDCDTQDLEYYSNSIAYGISYVEGCSGN